MNYMSRVDPAATEADTRVAKLEVYFGPGLVGVSITEGEQTIGVVFKTRETIDHVIAMLEKSAVEAFGPERDNVQ